MASDWYTTVEISKEMTHLADKVSKKLHRKILPRAMDLAMPILQNALIAKLPDGDQSNGGKPPSRSKQSEKSRSRFPQKMRNNVKIKKMNRTEVAMQIVGVTNRAAHVNFDHGDKAKSQGRLHKLWWVDNTHEVYAQPRLRKQRRDIPKIVFRENESRVVKVLESSIRQMVRSGELL